CSVAAPCISHAPACCHCSRTPKSSSSRAWATITTTSPGCARARACWTAWSSSGARATCSSERR
ncbi:MAG: hypothetical protein AVDCRST_MAG26-1624, partial [uncultured Chloroflexia bacterium]